MKKIATAVMLLLAGNAYAQAPQQMGDYDDWTAYTYKENGKNVCYMASTPKKDEGKYSKRGDIYVVITHRAGENSFDVFNIVAGYDYKKDSTVTVKIGKEVFSKFFTEKDKAWTLSETDDHQLIKAMKRGERMIVEGMSSRGTQTKDTYSLKGFTRAYQAISAKCGKKS
jgi:invasion protein IalB